MKLLRILTVFLIFLPLQSFATKGDADAGQTKAVPCFACHGPTGNTTVPEWPKLAAQHADYLSKQLMDFKAGQDGPRWNAVMYPNVTNLSEQDMLDISAYFASLEGQYGAADPQLVERGQTLYRGGDPEKGIPPCMACHGPAGEGVASAYFPRLSGQNAVYLVAQLQAFHSGQRYNDLNSMMRNVAKQMSDEDMQAVASYLNGLH